MKKTVIITGAAGNLGKTITASLLKQGYHVCATLGPNDDPKYLEHQNLISNHVNLFDEGVSEEYINFITTYQDVNIVALICLVGGYAKGNMETTNLETVQKMIDINFKTTYNVTRPLIRFCRKNKKPLQVIFIGTRPALQAESGKEVIAYGLAKSLVFKLAEYVNAEANTTNINASVIVPSTLDTPATRASISGGDPSMWVPTGNVAETILFILSDTGKMMREPIYKLYNKS